MKDKSLRYTDSEYNHLPLIWFLVHICRCYCVEPVGHHYFNRRSRCSSQSTTNAAMLVAVTRWLALLKLASTRSLNGISRLRTQIAEHTANEYKSECKTRDFLMPVGTRTQPGTHSSWPTCYIKCDRHTAFTRFLHCKKSRPRTVLINLAANVWWRRAKSQARHQCLLSERGIGLRLVRAAVSTPGSSVVCMLVIYASAIFISSFTVPWCMQRPSLPRQTSTRVPQDSAPAAPPMPRIRSFSCRIIEPKFYKRLGARDVIDLRVFGVMNNATRCDKKNVITQGAMKHA
jgi:hypothetical protein